MSEKLRRIARLLDVMENEVFIVSVLFKDLMNVQDNQEKREEKLNFKEREGVKNDLVLKKQKSCTKLTFVDLVQKLYRRTPNLGGLVSNCLR